jgi:cell division protein FtsI/penicillin-binding protein 2
VQARDAAGRWISTSDRKTVSSEEGPDIVLSIDRVIQHEVETILRDAVEKHGADGGTVIVMDPATGKILAMASNPGFDPNEYSKTEDYSRFLNPAVSQTYEPGSIMKPITMAIGIEEGKGRSGDGIHRSLRDFGSGICDPERGRQMLRAVDDDESA